MVFEKQNSYFHRLDLGRSTALSREYSQALNEPSAALVSNVVQGFALHDDGEFGAEIGAARGSDVPEQPGALGRELS